MKLALVARPGLGLVRGKIAAQAANSRQKSRLPGLPLSATVTGAPTAMHEGTQTSHIGAPAPGTPESHLPRRSAAKCALSGSHVSR